MTMLFRTKTRDPFTLPHLPVPRFLRPHSCGVDVSDHAIRLIELRREQGGLRLGSWGSLPLPRGAVIDGVIKDEQALIKALAELQKKHGLVMINASLPAEKAYYFRLELPGGVFKRREIMNVIESKLEERVPMAPQEALYDYTVVGSHAAATDIAVTVMQRDFVLRYLSVFRRAGFAPCLLEVEPEALARAAVPDGSAETTLILDFGELKTALVIAKGGVVLFTSSLETSGSGLTATIAEKLNISVEEAERLKRAKGFLHTEDNMAVYAALQEPLDALCDGIEKLRTFWRSRVQAEGHTGSDIDHIILCGGGANLKGFPARLSSALQLEAVLADVWVNVRGGSVYVPEIVLEDSLSYVTAVGLALAR